MAEYIGVGIISLAAFAVVFFLVIIAAGSGGRSAGSTGQTYAFPARTLLSSMNQGAPLRSTFRAQPLTGYHGTSMENALEIYTSGLWLIGSPLPRGVYIGDTIEIARQYSQKNGGIVVVRINPGLQLTDRGGGVYVCEVPEARPGQHYYKIEGLIPVGVISPQGTKIR